MEKAYLQTIQDFEIELANTEWWRFKRAAYLQSKYHYEYLLKFI
jgi:hypothetical protein